MAAEADALKNMVLSFRVSELQMLLGFAGRNKSGRKTELQARAVELLRLRSVPIQMKIKELYKTIQQGLVTGTVPPSQIPSTSTNNSTQNTMQQQQQQQQQQLQQQQQQRQSSQQQSSMVYNPSAYSNAPQHRAMYNAGMYHHQYPTKAVQPAAPNYPIHPDVRFKSLPFSELRAELVKPSSLVPHNNQRPQESTFVFHLTPQQATDIANNRDFYMGARSDFAVQVQLRFCLLETSCPQDDCFPPGIAVKVNNKSFPLPNPVPTNKPGVEPKRPPRPLNITPYVKLSPTVANNVTVGWSVEYGRGFVVAIYLVRKLTSTDLLQQLNKKGARHADFTRGLIKEKLNEDADCEIATTSLRVSVVCPLGKMRMTTPCRASTCQHLQCFDASLFLQMNEKKPTWNCPVCDKPALYDNLVIDGYFQQVLASGKLPAEGNEIQLHQDGTWSSMVIKKEKPETLTPMVDRVSSRIDLSDDLEVLPLPNNTNSEEPKKPEVKAAVIDLTFSDSEDESEPIKKPIPKPDSTEKRNSAKQAGTFTRTLIVSGRWSSSTPHQPSAPVIPSRPRNGVYRYQCHSTPRYDPRSSLRSHTDYAHWYWSTYSQTQDTTSVSSSSSGGSTSVAGGSVSSSGYISPNIITLDSPSPPSTPVPDTAAGPQPVFYPMAFLELDSDSNSPGHPSSLYPRY